ncbi:MAG: cytochrome oxidase, partial [Planctomycetota bacterium]
YLADPTGLRPGTTMPHLLDGLSEERKDQVVHAIAAYVSTLKKPLPEVKATGRTPVLHQFWRFGDGKRGADLYHQVGCVACHQPDPKFLAAPKPPTALDRMIEELDPEELAEMGLAAAARPVRSISLPDLESKYSSESLSRFLLDPTAVRHSGRMPNLKLTPDEAGDIAAYLLGGEASKELPESVADSALVEQGKRDFFRLRCNACHTTGDHAPPSTSGPVTLPWDQLDWSAQSNCLTEPHAAMPRYQLDDKQRLAITLVFSGSVAEKARWSPEDVLQLRLLQLNCLQCHVRDELGGVGRERQDYFETVRRVDLGDEGRLPPPLTHVGRKLTGQRMRDVLRDRHAMLRPHMTIRMPRIDLRHIDELADQFAHVDRAGDHGFPTSAVAATQASDVSYDQLVTAGRQLMDVGCVQCHAFSGNTLPGVVGVELNDINQRVRQEWFESFLLDPGKLKSRTRMPSFFPDGKSQYPGVLGGDPALQIRAMWAYLSQLPHTPLPSSILDARSADYELRPREKPILLRTFMDDAGTHAIAVGGIQGVHYAYDAERGLPATAWRGRFLNAQGTWFVRFSPPAQPLGGDVVRLPTLQLGDAESVMFGGYTVNSMGIPTFLLRCRDWTITDRITVIGKQLDRQLTLTPSKNSAPLSAQWLGLAKEVGDRWTTDQGVTVGWQVDADHVSESLRSSHQFLPNQPHQIKVTYQW